MKDPSHLIPKLLHICGSRRAQYRGMWIPQIPTMGWFGLEGSSHPAPLSMGFLIPGRRDWPPAGSSSFQGSERAERWEGIHNEGFRNFRAQASCLPGCASIPSRQSLAQTPSHGNSWDLPTNIPKHFILPKSNSHLTLPTPTGSAPHRNSLFLPGAAPPSFPPKFSFLCPACPAPATSLIKDLT